jgi:hypothetical protein
MLYLDPNPYTLWINVSVMEKLPSINDASLSSLVV